MLFKILCLLSIASFIEGKGHSGHHSSHHSSHHSYGHGRYYRRHTTYYSNGRNWRHSAGILSYFILINGNRHTIKQVDSDTCGAYHECSTDKGCCKQNAKIQSLTMTVDIEIDSNYTLPIFDGYYIDTELSNTIKRNIEDIMKDYEVTTYSIFINKIDSSSLIVSIMILDEHHIEYNTSFSLFNKTNWGSEIYNITDYPKINLHETNIYPEFSMTIINTNNLAKVGIFNANQVVSYDDSNWCYNNHCQNNANCYKQRQPYYICDCLPGYNGAFCENEYNVSENPCSKNAVYENGKCHCQYGYYGEDCNEVKECNYANCNDGICIEKIGSFECDCNFFSTGYNCDKTDGTAYCVTLIFSIILCCTLMQCCNNIENCIFDYNTQRKNTKYAEIKEDKNLSKNNKLSANV